MCHLLHVTSPGSPAISNPSPLWAPKTSTLSTYRTASGLCPPRGLAHRLALTARGAALCSLPARSQHKARADPELAVMVLANRGTGSFW